MKTREYVFGFIQKQKTVFIGSIPFYDPLIHHAVYYNRHRIFSKRRPLAYLADRKMIRLPQNK